MTVSDNGVQWFYKTPNGEEHGPFTSQDMMNWLEGGYFQDKLLIRTQNDNEFHSLIDYSTAIGNCPFLTDVVSFNSAAYDQRAAEDETSYHNGQNAYPTHYPESSSSSHEMIDQHQQQHNWMQMAMEAMRIPNQPPPSAANMVTTAAAAPMMFKPGPPASYHHPHPASGVYPPLMHPHPSNATPAPFGMPLLPQHGPSQIAVSSSYLERRSRPPSVPGAGGFLLHQHGDAAMMNGDPITDDSRDQTPPSPTTPKTYSKGTSTVKRSTRDFGTDPILFHGRDAGCQTGPLQVSSDEAAKLLSKLFGQRVNVSAKGGGRAK